MEIIDQLQTEIDVKTKALISMKRNHEIEKNQLNMQLSDFNQKISEITLDSHNASKNEFIEQRSLEIETLGILKHKVIIRRFKKFIKKFFQKLIVR